MSMQISVDPAGLSQEQREAVAGFILAYPSKACAGTCHDHAVAEIPAFIHKDTADQKLVELGRSLDPEIAALVKDDGEFQAGVAFGGHGSPELDADAAKLNSIFGQGAAGPTLGQVGLAPAAAFGSAPAPLPPGAIAAPTTPAFTPAISAPNAAASIAPTPPTLGLVSSAAPASPVGVELDSKGLPWDSRIHSQNRAKIADGTWRKGRGVDPTVVATVEAELRQVMGAPAAAPLAPSVPSPVLPEAPVTTPTAGPASSAVAAPAPPPAAPVVQPPPAPLGEVPADARAQFVALVGRASAAIQGQKVTQAEVNQCCVDAGVPALPLLANRLDLVAQVAAHIDALIAARQ